MSNLFSSGGAGNVGASGIDQQSLKFNDDESQYLSWTPDSAGNRKTWTWSGWVKRGNLGSGTGLFEGNLNFDGTNYFTGVAFSSASALYLQDVTAGGGGYNLVWETSALFRDPSAWYHVVVAFDTTQASSANAVKFYVNGTEQAVTFTAYSGSYLQNRDSLVNAANTQSIGTFDSANYFDGYLSDINFIDGQALDASSFGETVNGYWKAKDYSGTYGTNGFHLTFQDDVVSEGFNAVTYAGNGSTQSVSGLGFSPDLVWIKTRQAESHGLWDSVRGAPLNLSSNNTNAEGSYTGVTSFDSDGFSLGGAYAGYTESGKTYVAWCWDAGSGSAASNTDGSITSTVKANPSYGFSIVGWAGTDGSSQTVGHGLGAAPELFIIKNRTTAGQSWLVYTTAIDGSLDFLILEDTDAKTDSGANAPTSSVFSVAGNSSNKSGSNHIAYCFHSVAGYSSIGTYSGTGSSGNAVTGLGFKPAWLMIKRITANGGNWIIWDNTRDANDADVDNPLFPNLSDEEFTSGGTYDIQFDSDGFTINNASYNHNGSGAEFIYMAFADTREAAFWKDVSGQGNNWTPNNLDYRDSLPDSPANNFATLQPTAFVNIGGTNSAQTLSEGNLRYTGTTSQGRSTPATIRVTSGKYYAEATKISGTGSVVVDFVVNDAYAANKNTSTTGDIIIVAVDVDAGKYWSGLNGTWDSSGDPATGANPTGTFTANSSFTFGGRVFDNARVGHFNFGQDSTFAGAKPMGEYTDDSELGTFQYQPPAGFKSLCTANLPDPTIIDGSVYFNTVLYTGDGTGSRDIGGLLFAPDFTWIKNRTSAINHGLFDTVRGAGERLSSNLTNAETTRSDNLTLFNSDGFRVNSGSVTNQSGSTYASWNWKAGGTAVSNTDGSITSSVSANTEAGFSVVSWTGTGSNATVGHGLSSAPEMIINKNRIDNAGWGVYHSSLGATKYIWLQESNAAATYSNAWNDTSPTSSVFTVGSDGQWNGSGDGMISYCFHSVEGYSKAGSYTGNRNADGPFVYTGFRPAWVLIKRTDSTTDWYLYDAKRNAYNLVDGILQPNEADAEATSSNNSMDFTSNGFKLRGSGATINGTDANHIYLAFAENPFKYANAR